MTPNQEPVERWRFSLTQRIRCPECNAQEEEHCDTCGGKGYPTLKDLLALSRAEVLEEVRGKIEGMKEDLSDVEFDRKMLVAKKHQMERDGFTPADIEDNLGQSRENVMSRANQKIWYNQALSDTLAVVDEIKGGE